MPKLWDETIEGHRRAVRDAALDATAALVAAHGLAGVTMSRIAAETGIGRATLYKHFPDVEAVLVAWHERQVTVHLQHLTEARDHASDPARRLDAVLEAYALMAQQRTAGDIAALLHRGDHVARAQEGLQVFLRDLIADGVEAGDLRRDVPPDELAAYCLHALTAAGGLPSRDAAHRLVTVTLAGLRRQR